MNELISRRVSEPQSKTPVLVSVLVCTRNRGPNVVPTVRSILASDFPSLELLVLDQSDDGTTRDALAPVLARDPRLAYHHLGLPGKARALNRGCAMTRGQYVLLTDDDCEVLPNWIGSMVEEFERNPDVDCVFGRVDAGSFDPAEGYVPVCPISEPRTIRRLDELLTMPGWGNFGMGANMSIRAGALAHLHGWDECIGPGAKFGSGDDHDLSVRLLRAGSAIRFSSTPRVIHYGLRRWDNAGRDYRRIWFGLGGVFAKHLRCGSFYWGGIRVPVNQVRDCTTKLLHGERPYGVSYVASWLRGFGSGLIHPLDRELSRFVPQTEDATKYAGRVADVVLRHADRNSPDVPPPPAAG